MYNVTAFCESLLSSLQLKNDGAALQIITTRTGI